MRGMRRQIRGERELYINRSRRILEMMKFLHCGSDFECLFRALNYSDLIRVTRISGPDSGDSDKTT